MKDKIILFDGVCNLCNGAINFIIKHDPKGIFKFASLQGETGKQLLAQHNIDPQETDSIVLIDNDQVSVKSSAALRIAKNLNQGYPLLFGFMIIPTFIRNGVYDFIAANRYKWFGKKESCMLPTPELRSRFLD
ncbi:MAG TPA: thiol-disulfide oxidoreductase [Leeuwenhoekiella sp.]|uniref:thiol-disulfide oxidoreductase DCC family protein n=1 Tax=Leeuwenhoekiella palythoae TaxID=573501 RepID=UPI000C40BB4E|nr:thiol-disulfide oxidoreductase DCC family protein [Leeuwenhoekiella palythoae]MBH13940.1 thiol-disulfide oxidoreductase [Leeuwenhoekiella sp.]UBZ10841.1 thiol-disulfide oxidoreductase DCC family protein [Leeuwenhoekiella palythoae]HBO30877.1 thiol-disulfide oxidoreductase [Leeuwenhoekiella sp.]HCQ78005.1 thiol-disulfide oxidoreductase [Leeuwenhoekiella sp.]|tara:strand:+ start:6030 stop:6428 length:399 start_codon:yes stop_codon:yes gene_type:complete